MLIIYAILTFFMMAVIVYDTTQYKIPNWIVLAVILVYPFAVYISPTRPDWMVACVITIVTFAIGFVALLLRLTAAGDVKLITAAMLYANKDAAIDFIVLVVLAGGALAVFLLAIRPLCKYVFVRLQKLEQLPRLLTPGEKYMPYGVAIAAGFMYLLWSDKLPGLAL